LSYTFSFSFIPKYISFFIDGVKITILLALVAVVLGVLLGLIASLMRLSKFRVPRFLASAYIEFIRGTPLLVQLYIVRYGLGMIFPAFGRITPFVHGFIAMSMNSGAYVAEIFRAGILAVDSGQMEAARSLGMTKWLAMRKIIIPQAVKNIIPALGNEFVVVIKESSIVSVIGVYDLMYMANSVKNILYRPFEPLLFAALLYFIMTFTLGKGVGAVERRLRKSER
jgi:polar amino acid transport system permease protein